MDRERRSTSKWDWLLAAMPGVAKLMSEKRRELGDAHVNECWRRGVVERKPGWFFAREGVISVGMPWEDDKVLANFAALKVTSTQALLILAPMAGEAREP